VKQKDKTRRTFIKNSIVVTAGTFAIPPIIQSCDAGGKNLNSFVEGLHGSVKSLILKVDKNNEVVSSIECQNTRKDNVISASEGSEWKFSSKIISVSGDDDALDVENTWTLTKGKATQTAVAVSFDFDNWTDKNFVFAPAAIYNGNRFEVKKIDYPPYLLFVDEEEQKIDMPTTITQNPRLNKKGAGRIDLDTGNVATPLLGFHSPDRKKGWMVQTEQGNHLGNYGLIIEENEEHSKARFMLTSPSVRQTRPAGTNLVFPSGDTPADWKAGDSVTIRYRLYFFSSPSVLGFFKKFASVRKDLNPAGRNEVLPYSKAFELLENLYNESRWDEPAGLFRLDDSPEYRMVLVWQLGWVGGGQVTLPLLQEGEKLTKKRAVKNLETIFNKCQAKSGFFYSLGDGEIFTYDRFRPAMPPSMIFLRKQGDWLYMSQKQIEEIEASGGKVPPAWKEGVRKHADAFVTLWNNYDQFGQWADLKTGELLVGNSTACAIVCGGLALASKNFNNKKYLEIAKAAARKYYDDYVEKGYTTGGPGEILSAPDSESAFALLESYMTLYDVDGDKEWLKYAQDLLPVCASWTVSYDYEFPQTSSLGKVETHTNGSVVASIQNKHSAPGICTWSGDSLLKLYRATGNELALDLLTDIAHGITQYISRKDRTLGGLKAGEISERVNISDWEGKDKVGGNLFSASWCETAALLTVTQIPGIYLQPDKGVIAVFDNIQVEKLPHKNNTLKLRLTNPTSFAAQISVFVESSEDAKTPRNSFTINPLPKINIPANKSIDKEFSL
jgi:hypothetical protein